MSRERKPIREISDEALVAAPTAWRDHTRSRAAGSLLFGPSENELFLTEHCLQLAEEVLRLRRVIRRVKNQVAEADR